MAPDKADLRARGERMSRDVLIVPFVPAGAEHVFVAEAQIEIPGYAPILFRHLIIQKIS